MLQQVTPTILFKEQLFNSFQNDITQNHAIKIAKNDHIYNCGDQDDMIYFIESGYIKLVMLSPEGKECILAIHTIGDIFGEICLSELNGRLDTAKAMEDTSIKQIPRKKFFDWLTKHQLLENFITYLTTRMADQQQAIANLVMIDSEQRLGKILLHLARTLGKKAFHNILLEPRISQEELSEMVGTTRPRISIFMQKFRNLGLIEIKNDHYILVKEFELTHYLAQNG